MDKLPRISIIVPNLNSGKALALSLDSLFSQGYPDLEILVVDGGSGDESLEIVQSYASRLHWWVSEPDGGQTDAINKGIAHSTGEVLNWLNGDDILLPGALLHVGELFADAPQADIVAGAGEIAFSDGRRKGYIEKPGPPSLDLLPAYNGIVQQSCFFRRRALERTPPLDPAFIYAMDVELWCYFKSRQRTWVFTEDVLSRFTLAPHSKSARGGEAIAAELEKIYRTYSPERIPLSFWYRHLRYPFEKLLRRDRGLLRLAVLRVIQLLYIGALSPFYGFRRVWRMSWPE